MDGRARAAVAAMAALVLAAGCAGSSQGPQPTPGPWPAASSVELVATGMTLVGGSASGDLVIDGAGMAWADGPWQVARIDPATGAATTWDATDDVAFASVQRLAPAQPSGAWLIDGATARLFDGDRFVMTLTLPDGYRQGRDVESTVVDLLQVGERVYVAGPAGVARWEAGTWTPIGPNRLMEARALAVDAAGVIWAGGFLAGGPEAGPSVVRQEGTSWEEPDFVAAPSGEVGDLVADPNGGVWATSMAEGTPQHGVFRYDAGAWHKVGDGGYAFHLGVTTAGDLWAMTSGGDGLAGSGTLVAGRLNGDGSWQSYGQEDGAPLADEGASAALAIAGDRVLMLHEEGLVSLVGQRFEPIWNDPAAVLLPTFMIPADAVIATSADEVWLPATPVPAPAGAGTGGAPGAGLMRYRGGTWQRVGPDAAGDTQTAPVQASDGAIWEVSRFGELVRVEGEDATIVLPADDDRTIGQVVPAAGGAVWTVLDGQVVRVCTDGTRQSIGTPSGARLGPFSALAALGDDRVWVADGAVVRAWAEGRWTVLPAAPGSPDLMADLLAAPDGALWATGGLDIHQDSTLLRFQDGAWQVGPSGSRGLVPAPDATVCTIQRDRAGIACFDAGLSVTRTIPVGGPVDALGFARDGAVWVVGEQVARITPTVD